MRHGSQFGNLVEQWLMKRAPSAGSFWLGKGGDFNSISWLEHCDVVYTLKLLGKDRQISDRAAERFLNKVAISPLFGRPLGSRRHNDHPQAHLTAYILGTTRLLEAQGYSLPSAIKDGWHLESLVDANYLPFWPRAWSHHIWRVSHWIGGVPSILSNLAEWGACEGVDFATVERVLESCELSIVEKSTGLLKPYRSQSLQNIFRKLYSFKHDPEIADLGGIVHLLWVYHVVGRPYPGRAVLLEKATNQMLKNVQFMETVPYCLDFDIIQLLRTASIDQTSREGMYIRVRKLLADTRNFLENIPDGKYGLHKVPGALATMHECALFLDDNIVDGIGIPPVDIISEAHWL
jgi:hypothetical protein